MTNSNFRYTTTSTQRSTLYLPDTEIHTC